MSVPKGLSLSVSPNAWASVLHEFFMTHWSPGFMNYKRNSGKLLIQSQVFSASSVLPLPVFYGHEQPRWLAVDKMSTNYETGLGKRNPEVFEGMKESLAPVNCHPPDAPWKKKRLRFIQLL